MSTTGKTDAARSIGAAIEHVEEAQRLAGKLDQAANSKTGEALEAIKVATREVVRRRCYLRIVGADFDGDLPIRERIGRLRQDQRLARLQHDDRPLIQRGAAGSVGDFDDLASGASSTWSVERACRGLYSSPSCTLMLPFGRICGVASTLMMPRRTLLPVLRMLPVGPVRHDQR